MQTDEIVSAVSCNDIQQTLRTMFHLRSSVKDFSQVPENACTYNEKTVTNQPGTFRRCLYRSALRMADWAEVNHFVSVVIVQRIIECLGVKLS